MTPDVVPIILPLVWGAILALAVFLYVLLGGYDLGLGVLFPLAPTHQDRDAMMGSVAPFWDGNETWLVLGGGGLLAAFPFAYAVMLPALYIPIILMLIGLILRGVAFEFRFKSSTYRWAWDLAFAGGSIVAALMQGLIIGAFVQGFNVENNQFAGGPFDWLTPFSLVTALAVVAGYVLLSAGWLIMKGDEALRDWAYGVARYALVAVAAFILIFSLWTPLIDPAIAKRWFTPANMVMLSPVPLLTAASIYGLWLSLKKRWRSASHTEVVGTNAASGSTSVSSTCCRRTSTRRANDSPLRIRSRSPRAIASLRQRARSASPGSPSSSGSLPVLGRRRRGASPRRTSSACGSTSSRASI